jgi:hypothetical protein
MSNKNQTAVEWLINEFSEILGPLETKPIQDLLMVDAIKQAKELEKQQQGYSEEEVIKIAKQYAKRCQAPIQSNEWLYEYLTGDTQEKNK